jgi:hypothetical protein
MKALAREKMVTFGFFSFDFSLVFPWFSAVFPFILADLKLTP